MTMGLVGRKCGMTRVFTDDGVSIPVTVIEAQPNRITQVKTVETDGYRALQVSAGSRKASRVRKPAAGHFAAAKVEAGDLMMEFRLEDTDAGEFEKGNELKVDLFEEGQKVDVKVLEVDRQGRIRLSMKALIEEPAKEEPQQDTPAAE